MCEPGGGTAFCGNTIRLETGSYRKFVVGVPSMVTAICDGSFGTAESWKLVIGRSRLPSASSSIEPKLFRLSRWVRAGIPLPGYKESRARGIRSAHLGRGGSGPRARAPRKGKGEAAARERLVAAAPAEGGLRLLRPVFPAAGADHGPRGAGRPGRTQREGQRGRQLQALQRPQEAP